MAYVDIVKGLLERHANVNHQDTNGITALMWAIYRGHLDIVKALLEGQINLDLQNKDGKTALDYARDKGIKDIMNILVQVRISVLYVQLSCIVYILSLSFLRSCRQKNGIL